MLGTQQYPGLIVLNLRINNADLRTPNNIVYERPVARDGARRWFVVRDLGGSLGATGFAYGTRNDSEGVERQGFILSSSRSFRSRMFAGPPHFIRKLKEKIA